MSLNFVGVNWNKLDAYGKHNIEYKDRAREAIINGLGFEPPVYVSLMAELHVRNILKSVDDGKRDPKTLDKSIDFQCSVVKSIIKEFRPELWYLLNKN